MQPSRINLMEPALDPSTVTTVQLVYVTDTPAPHSVSCSSTRGRVLHSSEGEGPAVQLFCGHPMDANRRVSSTYNDYNVPRTPRATNMRTALSFRNRRVLRLCNGCCRKATVDRSTTAEPAGFRPIENRADVALFTCVPIRDRQTAADYRRAGESSQDRRFTVQECHKHPPAQSNDAANEGFPRRREGRKGFEMSCRRPLN